MTKTNVFMPLSYDRLFMSIFGNEDNIEILEAFLEDIFGYERGFLRNKVLLRNRNLPTVNKNNAQKQVDIVAQIDKNLINLELNNSFREGLKRRNLVYLSAVHATQLKKIKKSYNNVGNSIQINLNRGGNLRYTVEPFYLVNYRNLEFTMDIIDYLSIIMVDLIKGKAYNRDRIDKWCTLILASTLKEFLESLKGIEMKKELKDKLKEQVEKFNEDEEEIAIYCELTRQELEHNTELEDAKEDGFESGKEAGINQEKRQIALNLLKSDLSIEEISKATSLSVEELKKLQ